jgi:hypothetical protein
VEKTLPLALTKGRRRTSFPLWKRINVGSCLDAGDVLMLYLGWRGCDECEERESLGRVLCDADAASDIILHTHSDARLASAPTLTLAKLRFVEVYLYSAR